MKRFIKKFVRANYVYIILVVIVLGVSTFLNFKLESSTSSWIGYWGNIWGGVLGGIITLVGVRMTLNKDSKKEHQQIKQGFEPVDIVYTTIIQKMDQIERSVIHQGRELNHPSVTGSLAFIREMMSAVMDHLSPHLSKIHPRLFMFCFSSFQIIGHNVSNMIHLSEANGEATHFLRELIELRDECKDSQQSLQRMIEKMREEE